MNKFTIKFDLLGEVRMGSPYNAVKVVLDGEYVPDTSGFTFQDKALVSDGLTCYLVQWDLVENIPGFIVWKIDSQKNQLSKSNRVNGCCDGILIKENQLICKVWKWDSQSKSESISELKIDF